MRTIVFFLLMVCSLQWSWAQDPGPPPEDGAVPTDPNVVLQLQIFLDRHLFGPGKLDGAAGEFTYKAVVNYNFAMGYRDLYDWTPALRAAAEEVPVIFAAFNIRGDLDTFVNPALPEKPEEQVHHSYMAYRSYAELVAERFHTDEGFLAKCNPELDVTRLRPGDVVVVPNVRSFRIEEVKSMQSFGKDVKLSANTIVVDTTERMAAVYSPDERLLAAFPITPGKPEFIPVGTWSMKTMMTTPSFRYDKQFLEGGVRGKEAYQLPPGPNSPVGIIWCGLSKSGIGLHGTALPRTIGRSQSAGCVRLANWDAIRLPTLVRPDSRVIVR
ncbi:L,D-transpeptidase [Prosthecobacter fusiformis]|nr:L,D-transpeptidase [Prosthecobacter fusiformis]